MNHTQESLTSRPNWTTSNIWNTSLSFPYLLDPLSLQPLSHSALLGFSDPQILSHLPYSNSTRESGSEIMMVSIWEARWWFSHCGPWT